MTDDQKTVAGRAGLGSALHHGLFLLLEKLLRWCVNPRLRAWLLRLLGATIGKNVRVYEIQLFNLENGFRNLDLGDNVHVGPRCSLDLAGRITIGHRSTLSPGVMILTHADPGSSHDSRLTKHFPAKVSSVSIGRDCWLGANTTVLAGIHIADLAVTAAGAVVVDDVTAGNVVAGVPARVFRSISP